MSAPDFMPVLSAGAHSSPKEGACILEYVSMLAGEPFTDHPSCTHPVLASAARSVNDRLSDSERHLLVPLIGRLFGTAETGTAHERKVLSVRLAVYSARTVLHLIREQDRAACVAAVDTAEAWTRGEATEQECRDAAANAAHAYAYAAAAAAYAVDASAAAAAAAYAAAAAANAANAAAHAAHAAALVGSLSGLIDEYDRLTGRTTHRHLDANEYAALASRVG